MTVTGGTKRVREDNATSQKSRSGEQNREDSTKASASKTTITATAAIPKHSSRKRTKLSQLRDNRRIHKAAAAMQGQLDSFDRSMHRCDQNPDGTSTSFSVSSYFELGSQRDGSDRFCCDDDDPKNNQCCSHQDLSEEFELAALARSLHLEESSSSSGGGRAYRHRRRGAISIVMSPRR